MIDVIIVGLVVLAAIIALIVIVVKLRKERKTLGEKVKGIVEEAKKNIAPSVLVD
jgi:hypothetical protein